LRISTKNFRRRDKVITHSFKTPKFRIVEDRMPTHEDVLNAERLLVAFRVSPKVELKGDIWARIGNSQSDFFEILHNGSPEQLASYLCNMSRHSATTGTVQGNREFAHLKRSFFYRRYLARMAADKILLLAEALGVISLANPEQTGNDRSDKDFKAVLSNIEKQLGLSLVPPNIDGGLLKIWIGPAKFNERDCNAIYTASLLKTFKNVCEIGGGSGRVAYWAHHLGIPEYTIIDLPQINVIQGFYLMSSLGGDSVQLFGESKSAPIKIVPNTAYRQTVNISRFDVVLNQDSFPEMSQEVAIEYLEWIAGDRKNLISINHENQPRGTEGNRQNRVSSLFLEIKEYELISRQQYWLRRGYALETWGPRLAPDQK
jgi:hypothetical protein